MIRCARVQPRRRTFRKQLGGPGINVSMDAMVAAILEWMASLQGTVSLAALEGWVATGNIEAIIQAYPWAVVGAALADALRETFTEFMNFVASGVATDLGILPSFVLDNPFAVTWAANESAAMVTLVTDSTKAAIRSLIASSITDGQAPRVVAREIRAIIGLRPDQIKTLENLQAALLLQGRSDADIARLLATRANRMLAQRALLIARTELTNAQAQGLLDSWKVAQNEGFLSPFAVKEWIQTPDDRLSEICRELGNHAPVPINEPFFSNILGRNIMAPSAHPDCRSTLGLRELTEEQFLELRAAA